MYSLISSPKRGGAAHSKLSDRGAARLKFERPCIPGGCRSSIFLLLVLASSISQAALFGGTEKTESASTSKAARAAASRCGEKLKDLEDFAAKKKSGEKQTTRFTEEEINAYLDLNLKAKYHPSLESLAVAFEEENLQGVASIDFDRLGGSSSGLLPKVVGMLFSGTHTLKARGKFITREGKAHFQLEKAYFDDSELPKFLVEEIITAVGRKQNPPFDPLQPSTMPYEIKGVEMHPEHIVVHQ